MINCLNCGNYIGVPNTRGRKPKFCSSTCKEFYRRKRNKTIITDETCQQCGKQLNHSQVKSGTKYCSHNCSYKARRIFKGTKRICLVCRNYFEPRSSEQKYCSTKCAHIIIKNTLRLRFPRVKYKCKNCGKEFTPKTKDRISYCSRECAFIHRVSKPKPLKEPKLCKWCKQPTASQKQQFCSNQCQKDMTKAKIRALNIARYNLKVTSKQCKCCGKNFLPTYSVKFRSFCSYECSKNYNRRISKATRRARVRNLPYEAIDPIAVFIRDDWKCHVCKETAPESLRGTINPLAPELDHIIPLAKGGHHIWSNVACCHRKCNLLKSDHIISSSIVSKS